MEAVAASNHFVDDIGIFLLAAIAGVVLLHRFRLSPVLGYLAAGVVIGPNGLALVENTAMVRGIAEFGVVFLMFAIGLELSFDRLRNMRRAVFGMGGLQVTITMTVVGGITYLFTGDSDVALVVGGGLALSSTAVVLQVLNERAEIGTRVGRGAFAVLLMQDLAVVPMLFLVQMLADKESSFGTSALIAVGGGILALLAATIIGRVVLRPIYRLVAATDSAEIFIAVVILTVGAFAVISEMAGFSLALGAFLAGLLVAETEYRHQVEMDIEPFKGLLLGLFFMTVGMSLSAQYILSHVVEILTIIALVLVIKGGILTGLGLAFRLSLGESLQLGLVLAQMGEFAFVILALAASLGVLSSEMTQILLAATGVSLALTPLMAAQGARLQTAVDGNRLRQTAASLEDTGTRMNNHVIIAGYGRVGRAVARTLNQHKIAYIALDLDPERVAEAFSHGYNVYYGNADRPDVLKAAGIGRAAAFVTTIDNPAAAARAVRSARQSASTIPILARAHDAGHCRVLGALGAGATVLEAMEGSFQLAGRVLQALGMSEEIANQTIGDLRRENYREITEKSANLPKLH